MNTYAAFFDNAIRDISSSGGIFSLLASEFDVIYGVKMTEDNYGCEFVRIEGDVSSLRGSKYIQAVVGDTYKQVKLDLDAGRKVLFSGTGCQVNGLACFLQKEYDNLILLDVICHGVPSPKLWKKYAEWREEKFGKLKEVCFRSKENSWEDFGMKENDIYIPKDSDPFMKMFLKNNCLRPSCYECRAKSFKKSDLTIGDFWGIENIVPEMNDGKGISIVITRSPKGQMLFELIKNRMKWKDVDYKKSIKYNTAEYKSVDKPNQREKFFKDLDKISFDRMVRRYAVDNDNSLYRRFRRKFELLCKK